MENDAEDALPILLAGPSTQKECREAVQTLAEGSRQSNIVRERLAEPRVLEILLRTTQLQIYDTQPSEDLVQSALRCLGNTCIDNDGARTFVASKGFTWAIPLLQRRDYLDLRKLTVLVLYNICSDHEIAQKQAYKDAVHIQLIDLLGAAAGQSTMLEQPRLIELFFWLSIHHRAADEKPAITGERLCTLLTLPTRLAFDNNDIEQYAELVEASLGFLRDEQIQQQAIESNLDHLIFEILERNELQVYRAESEEDVKLLIPISASLTWVLSDLVALPGFALNNTSSPESRLVSKALATILRSGDDETPPVGLNDARLVNAACQVVGNYVFALAPAKYESFITQTKLHVSILTLMTRVNNSDFLHSASGLLTLLSRPSVAAREAIGAEPRAAAALEKLCRSDVRQLKEGGVKLIRALGRDCPSNQQRFAELAIEALTDLAAASEQPQTATLP